MVKSYLNGKELSERNKGDFVKPKRKGRAALKINTYTRCPSAMREI